MSLPHEDVAWLEKLQPLITAISDSYGLPAALVGAIVSRESGGGRLLGKNGCPPGTGDRGHGRGLMQIDDRWHTGFLGIGDLWTYPAANISYGCWILRTNLDWVERRQEFTGMSEEEQLRTAVAAYNTGPGRVSRAVREGKGVDYYTFGGDYSEDVFHRKSTLAKMGWKD